MKIPRYWAKATDATLLPGESRRPGKTVPHSCWGWSDTSLSEAEEKSQQRTNAINELLRKGELDRDRYSYGDQPMREPILDEWKTADGVPFAAITRNSYGCEVLNTAAIMFVDIDLQEPPVASPVGRWLKRLFGKAEPAPAQSPQETVMDTLRATVARDASRSMRVYRTCSGLRCLLTQTRADPKSDTTLQAMASLGADPLYIKLCRTQECFRARLTPKPWRCNNMTQLQVRYPWRDDAAAQKVKEWCGEYAVESQPYATCDLIERLGSPAMDAEMARVVKFHDEATKVGSNLKLA